MSEDIWYWTEEREEAMSASVVVSGWVAGWGRPRDVASGRLRGVLRENADGCCPSEVGIPRAIGGDQDGGPV